MTDRMKKPVFTTEALTPTEMKRLNKMVLGYRNFKSTAVNAGLHVETLRGVIQRGYGLPETIEKIRTVIGSLSKVA